MENNWCILCLVQPDGRDVTVQYITDQGNVSIIGCPEPENPRALRLWAEAWRYVAPQVTYAVGGLRDALIPVAAVDGNPLCGPHLRMVVANMGLDR